ncbi:MAG: sulfite reductase subunit alpha [Burkholderiaceae bacterium]
MSKFAWAVLLTALYVLLCVWIFYRQRRRRPNLTFGNRTCHVVYASQTGTAEGIARQTAHMLGLAGLTSQAVALGEVSSAMIARAERLLFVVSTYGEGDAPDTAQVFAEHVIRQTIPLANLRYGLLALGDSAYPQFCAFGRRLDGWLLRQGAQAMFERIEMDGFDRECLNDWRHRLAHLANTGDAPDWDAPRFDDWVLQTRLCLNPLTEGAPAYHLELRPVAGQALPDWQAGDLAQIALPAEPDRPRDYSIASVPADGAVHLLVRLHRHGDGRLGAASGWLTSLPLGATIRLRVRAHQSFRLGANAGRPLILIANGTGMAGLRALLKARIAAGQTRQWLIFGERQAQCDYFYREEIERWQNDGFLSRLDLVFSRDTPVREYVQHRLAAAYGTVQAWVAEGAALYVCGSLQGMAEGVHRTLTDIVGDEQLAALTRAGRYCRDVY